MLEVQCNETVIAFASPRIGLKWLENIKRSSEFGNFVKNSPDLLQRLNHFDKGPRYMDLRSLRNTAYTYKNDQDTGNVHVQIQGKNIKTELVSANVSLKDVYQEYGIQSPESVGIFC